MEHARHPDASRVEAAIGRWQRELLDLSRNNRLLFFQPVQNDAGDATPKRRGQGGIRIVRPEPFELFDRLANREQKQRIARIDLTPAVPNGPLSGAERGEHSPGLPPLRAGESVGIEGPHGRVVGRGGEVILDADPARYDQVLYRLRLRARSALLEQGIDVLYVAFGLLEWTIAGASAVAGATLTAGERIASPLLLLPVRLERARSVDPYTLTPLDERPILNPALAFQLQNLYQIELTLPDPDGDGDLDYTRVLDRLREQVSVRPDWSVQDGAYLGLFSFAKQAMYADLDALRARLTAHPVVRALAGEHDTQPPFTLPDPGRLDEQEHPQETFQVLDADASQRTVLAAIRSGSNLVVQGPPGTGKSQSIANAIAEALAQGKSVLFVSEKLAALQVVAKRLRVAGLGEFCLEAHGHGGDKAAVVRALAAALPETPRQPASPPLDELRVLAERRAALNAYARALHDADNPLGASAFAIHGELAMRAAAPRIIFEAPNIETLTMERTGRMVDLVRRLVPVAEVVTAPEQHPWFGCTLTRWNPLVQARLETTLSRLARAADELREVQMATAGRWGLGPEPSLAGARWLAEVVTLLDERPPALTQWLARPVTADLAAQVRDWGVRTEGYRQRRARLLGHYTEAVFALDLPGVIAAFECVDAGAIGHLRGDSPPADRALLARSAVEQAAGRALQAIPATLAAAAEVAAVLGTAAPTSRPEMERLLQAADLIRADPRPERRWLVAGQLGLLADLADEAARQCERVATSRAALVEQFDESVLTAITPVLAERFETTYGSWLRYLRPGWYADLGLLRRHLRADPTADAAEGLEYAAAAEAIGHWRTMTAAEDWLATQAAGLADAFGRHYLGGTTDWLGIQGAIETVRQLGGLLGDLTLWPRVSTLLLESGGPGGPESLNRPARILRAALVELDGALAELGRWSTPHPPTMVGGWGVLPNLAADLERWLAALAPVWAASDALHTCRNAVTTSASILEAEARDALACLTFERELAAAAPVLEAELGPFFAGLETDWLQAANGLAWAGSVRSCFDRSPPASFLAALDASAPGPAPERVELNRALARLHELRAELAISFAGRDRAGDETSGPRIGSQPMERVPLSALADWARSRHADLPRLQEWIDTQSLRAESQAAGLGGFVDGLVREAPPARVWVDAFLRQLFTQWLTWRRESSPPLEQFRRPNHEAMVADLRELDRRQWELAVGRISARLLARRPGRAGASTNGSEVGLLLREARKQRRFKPLRRLFAELPHLLPQLKPCLMMSPLSVAQHLGDSAVTFDLVIFDEASQVLPADAIGAIGRARQVVVVGDRRQLPPTRFFQVTAIDTRDDDPDEEPPESILDACLNAGLPECSLLWHYRSRHEHLIAFSNAAFYDGRLRTFPSPDADEQVVTFKHVPDGVYDRGGTRVNRAEAEVVADLVVEHVEEQASRPDGERESLGVIAFSEAQMLAILDVLEARTRDRPELEPLLAEDGTDGVGGASADEGLFVKNLESVQGDERDVIIFSVGYGKDVDGRLTMSFGPLNAAGGERRLNVAVTRARRRLTVVSSIRAHEIDGRPERPAGVRQLKRYLEYAERGPTMLPDGGAELAVPGGSGGGEATVSARYRSGRKAGSPFEAAVQAALVAALADDGVEVVAGVGVGEQPVDLAIRDRDGRYVLAIECDGRTFASLPTARDRDRLRHEVLERLGWKVHRVWSAAWVLAQRDEEQRVREAVTRARLIRDGLLTDDAPLAVLKPEDRPSQGPSRPQGLLVPTKVPAMRAQLGENDRLGIGEPPPLAPPPCAGEREQEDRLPLSSPERGPGGEVTPARPIESVPAGEIVEAVRAVLQRDFSMPADDLIVAVARGLGYRRTGGKIRRAVSRVIQRQLADGLLTEAGGNLRLADS